MHDSEFAEHFDHIDMFWEYDPFNGIWQVRCGTRYQSAEGGPDNFYGRGETIVEAVINLLYVLRTDIRRRAQAGQL
jgi:hypothetical protein